MNPGAKGLPLKSERKRVSQHHQASAKSTNVAFSDRAFGCT